MKKKTIEKTDFYNLNIKQKYKPSSTEEEKKRRKVANKKKEENNPD